MSLYLIDYENVSDGGLNGIKDLTVLDKVVVFYGQNTKNIPFDRMIEITTSGADVEFILSTKMAKNYLDFQLTTYLGFLIGSGFHGEIYIISKDTGFDSAVDFWLSRNFSIVRQEAINVKKKKKSIKDVVKAIVSKDDATKKKKKKDDKKKTSDSKKTETGKKKEASVKEEEKIVSSSEKKEVKKTTSSTEKSEPKKAEKKEKKQETSTGRKSPALPESVRKKVRAAIKDEKLASTNYTKIYGYFDNMTKEQMESTLLRSFGQEKGSRLFSKLCPIYEQYRQETK